MPGIRHDAGQLALFDIQDADFEDLGPAVLLQVDGTVFPVVIDGGVVQFRDGFQAAAVHRGVGFPLVIHPVLAEGKHAVGIQQIGMEAVDHLADTALPVIPELFVGGVPGGAVAGVLRSVLLIGMVEIPVRGIVAVVGYAGVGTVFVAALVDTPPGEGSAQVLADAEGHAEPVRGLLPHEEDILMGADVDAVHAVEL